MRRLAIRSLEWAWWDRFVLLCIAVNSLQLAMYDPFDTPDLLPDNTNMLSGAVLRMRHASCVYAICCV